MPATFVRTGVAALALALRARVLARTGLDPSRVAVSAHPDEYTPRLTAESDVVIRPADEDPHPDAIDGSGVFDNRRTRSFSLLLRSRQLLDQAGHDELGYLAAASGHEALEAAVLDAVELFLALDAGSDALCVPARGLAFERPRRPIRNRDWQESTLSVAVEYERALVIVNDPARPDFR